jgi:hypothetical protein
MFPMWRNFPIVCAELLAGMTLLQCASVAAQGPRPFERDLLAVKPLFIELRAGAAPAGPGPGRAPTSFPPKDSSGSAGSINAPATAPAAMGIASLRTRSVDAEQRYYTLLATRENTAVIVFSAEGIRLAQIPATPFITATATVSTRTTPPPVQAAPTAAAPARATAPEAAALLLMPPAQARDAKLVFASDFDVDADGRIYIADRGADAIKIYDSTGALLSMIPVQAPVSVAVLPGGEIAVSNLLSEKLVTVFALRANPVGGASTWKVVREFGDPADITSDEAARELNRFVNIGRLTADAEGNLYYTFFYLPEPTVRKYDRWGYLISEVALSTPEFQPSAQSQRRAIDRLRQSRFTIGGSGGPILRQSVTALGVDPQNHDVWVAMGTQLLHFDKDGSRRGTYRTYAPDSQRVEASAILVEPDRLILSSDALGAFEFPRPDKHAPAPRPGVRQVPPVPIGKFIPNLKATPRQ